MRTSTAGSALRVGVALLTCTPCASEEARCTSPESCAAAGEQGLSQDSLLLQSKFIHSETRPSKLREDPEASGGEVHEEEYWKDAHGKDAHGEFWFWGRKTTTPEPEPEDWMLETTEDHEWLAGGDAADEEFAKLSDEDKVEFTKAAHKDADQVLAEGGDEAKHEREAARKVFATEHQIAVRKLREHPDMMKFGPKHCKRYEGAGGISGLYTFGAPGTCICPFHNPLSEDGKFPGLRMLTQRIRPLLWGITRTYSDPVPFVAGIVGMKHPHMDVLVLPLNHTPEWYDASYERSTFPRSDMAFWIDGHYQTTYTGEYLKHKDKFDPMVWEMMILSNAVSPYYNNFTTELNAQEAGTVGWNLVAQSLNTKLDEDDIIFQDNTSLYQHPVTQACALSFVGTHHVTQWIVNLRFLRAKWCGIPNVHVGFRDQVRRAIRSPAWASDIRPALEACPALYVTGHSLGAGQAQMVAACLQRAPAEGEDGWDDYKHLVWVPDASKARTLPSLAP